MSGRAEARPSERGRRVACTDYSLPSIGLSRLRWEARTGGSAAPPGEANNNAAFAALRWRRGPSRTGTTARSTRCHPATE